MLFLLRYVPKQYLLQTCVAFWLLWLLIGTLFYSYNGGYYWTNGFYNAVNAGYSIGWGGFLVGLPIVLLVCGFQSYM
jgi:hypothetical protein